MDVSVMKCPHAILFFLSFVDEYCCRAFALILSYMQKWWQGGWFADVSAGL
jgi:hypothetical protein